MEEVLEERTKYKIKLPDLGYFERAVKCNTGCPVATDARGYVIAIAEGRYEEAYALSRETNPFSSLCGRVCTAGSGQAPCEGACTAGDISQPISIRSLKRFVTERYGAEAVEDPTWTLKYSVARGDPTRGFNTGEKVAIIGGGPGAFSAAHDLAMLGYRVTVFDAFPDPGGFYGAVIQEYWLPRKVFRAEIDAITSMGVEYRGHTIIGRDISFDQIKKEYRAVILARPKLGMPPKFTLSIDGLSDSGVMEGTDFLKDVNLQREELRREVSGKRVTVLGGGMVAIDCGRSAIRLGAAEARIYVLESLEGIPHYIQEEMSDAAEEDVLIFLSSAPKKIRREKGKIVSVQLIKVASVLDGNRKFAPTCMEGSEWECETDIVIDTIATPSRVIEMSGLKVTSAGVVPVYPEIDSQFGGRTPGLFALGSGDCATRSGNVIASVANGQKVAKAVDEYISGRKWVVKTLVDREVLDHRRDPIFVYSGPNFNRQADITPRVDPPKLSPGMRKHSFESVECVYPEEMARQQADRCVRCHVDVVFAGDRCILCNGCVDQCPEHCLFMVRVDRIAENAEMKGLIEAMFDRPYQQIKEETPEGAWTFLMDNTKCTRCGLCAKRCPTEAITMEAFKFRDIFVEQETGEEFPRKYWFDDHPVNLHPYEGGRV